MSELHSRLMRLNRCLGCLDRFQCACTYCSATWLRAQVGERISNSVKFHGASVLFVNVNLLVFLLSKGDDTLRTPCQHGLSV